jgi:hypothetical protein
MTPIQRLNQEYAFVTVGGGHHILHETKGVDGRYKLEHLNEVSFHKKLAPYTVQIGDKPTPVSQLWIKAKNRREYKGLCFLPEQPTPEGWYNLWRGFSVEPWPKDKKPPHTAASSLKMFLDHTFENVCKGEQDHFNWIMGYYAHLFQKPWEKPLVAIVFRGMKGVGKNAFIERIGALLGNHFLLASNKRYLVGNFNGHLENILLFVLDEAFWSGDKQAESTLKDLITGKTHLIEHKGKEPYTVENCCRVCIIGNEQWLVPASHDERRFAVFDVAPNRRLDTSYFRNMREGMERGGYRLLLRHFLDLDISKVNINFPPNTKALHDQKLHSLKPVHKWWRECLDQGFIVHSEFSEEWPADIKKDSLRDAYRRYHQQNQISGRLPDDTTFGIQMKEAGIFDSGRKRENKKLVYTYKLPELTDARKKWENFIGHEENWE